MSWGCAATTAELSLRSMRFRARWSASALLLLCGSCAESNVSSPPATTPSALAGQVLADGSVSPLELREVRQAVVDCLAGHGWIGTYDGDSLAVKSASGPTIDDAALERDMQLCQDPFVPVFVTSAGQTGVDQEQFQIALAACLYDAGLVEEPGKAPSDLLDEVASRHPEEFRECATKATG